MFYVAVATGGYYILLWPGLGLLEAGGQQQQRRRDRDQHGAGWWRRGTEGRGSGDGCFHFYSFVSNLTFNYFIYTFFMLLTSQFCFQIMHSISPFDHSNK